MHNVAIAVLVPNVPASGYKESPLCHFRAHRLDYARNVLSPMIVTGQMRNHQSMTVLYDYTALHQSESPRLDKQPFCCLLLLCLVPITSKVSKEEFSLDLAHQLI